MRERRSFKKILAAIGSLTMVGPVSLTVAACGSKETKQRSKNVDELITYLINNTIYSKQIVRNNKIEHLKKTITANFVKNKLSKEVSKHFKNDLFSLIKITDDKGVDLTDDDFKVAQTINAKINYDYGTIKNQNTNLKINVQEDRIPLSDVFKDFYFTDDKGVENFIDANDLDLITKQIVEYLGESLNLAGLILKNQMSTSIQLEANDDSESYIGEITLTWNLKFIEIWTSVATEEVDDVFLKTGLLGYFYEEVGTNQIKYLDVYKLKSGKERIIHKWIDKYYSITFQSTMADWNRQTINFSGKWLTSEIESVLGVFYLGGTFSIEAEGPETDKIKFFQDNKWENLSKSGKIVFDGWGRLR